MARIEWVKRRLENWGRWYARDAAGYAAQSVLERGPIVGSIDEVRLPILELEASETNDAVESLKLGHGHLYQTLKLYYLRGFEVVETARYMRRAPSTIHAQLGEADRLIAIWLGSKQEARQRATDLTVRRLSQPEIDALLQQLAEEKARLEAQRRPRMGPPRPPEPPFRRNRPTLRIKR